MNTTRLKQKKYRFNVIDILLLLVIISAVAILVYIFVINDADDTETLVEYTIEIAQIRDDLLPEINKIKPGDTIIDSIFSYNIGNVKSIEIQPYIANSTDMVNGIIVKEAYSNFSRVVITIRAKAATENGIYLINGKKMLIGVQVHFRTPSFVNYGYCTYISEVTEETENTEE